MTCSQEYSSIEFTCERTGQVGEIPAEYRVALTLLSPEGTWLAAGFGPTLSQALMQLANNLQEMEQFDDEKAGVPQDHKIHP